MTFSHSPGRRAPDAEAFAFPRLLEGGSERERRLLGSARFDGVPDAARDRFASALGIPEAARLVEGELAGTRGSAAGQAALDLRPGARTATGGAPNLVVSGAARLGKRGAMLLGALGVVGAIVASRWAWSGAVDSVPVAPVVGAQADLAPEERRMAEPSEGSVASSRMAVPSEQASSEARVRALAGVVAPLKPDAATARPSRARGSRSKAPGSSVTEKTPVAAPIGGSEPAQLGIGSRGLLEEVRWLEEVSGLLKANQYERAASALTRYERRYPEGELAIEAALLRVELALARGERALGLKLARELLARPAASRYRARLSRLLGEPTRSTDAAREMSGSNADAAHMRGRR
jgi:hypothetical protein